MATKAKESGLIGTRVARTTELPPNRMTVTLLDVEL